ncbi:hypothetical protein [Clostridium manihotivorum]|uniref:Uncharacterized protein n=1 Tax=Clostridium manihotivorum TaxID=2320868 RepID=A0A3R5QY95_9CLOT|nr:hypothetical protein [Clostridium manihotivorum]QAA32315.1 hypothetical protein C1I91_12080 [Clostridium manihotivorum]
MESEVLKSLEQLIRGNCKKRNFTHLPDFPLALSTHKYKFVLNVILMLILLLYLCKANSAKKGVME